MEFLLEKMLQTHKYHINTAITGTCIKQPFTISYMLKFICMLKASKQMRNSHVIERSVGNAYVTLTEEERQRGNRKVQFQTESKRVVHLKYN
ncbi:hypothetical protein T07_14588 [Trichinella nelsoni]|uniref:Uncharacterized protein n=1 Tax=Trichinella nelsoni TaxID=6336 RepID=A0A0V0RK00_9BILA|nr:hypothetical protein T07_14588 [Trichinella nelsoni]